MFGAGLPTPPATPGDALLITHVHYDNDYTHRSRDSSLQPAFSATRTPPNPFPTNALQHSPRKSLATNAFAISLLLFSLFLGDSNIPTIFQKRGALFAGLRRVAILLTPLRDWGVLYSVRTQQAGMGIVRCYAEPRSAISEVVL